MSRSRTSSKRRNRLSVVRRSHEYPSCERCGKTGGDGLTRCRGCGTVYDGGG